MSGALKPIANLLGCILVAFVLNACQTAEEPIRYSNAPDFTDPALTYVQQNSELTYKEGWFQDGDQSIHFVEAGDGPLIILYHGFPSFWLSWRDQIEELAQDHRVVALDALGAGLSSKPIEKAPYRVEDLSAQLDRFAHALAPDVPFVLIGHDWGAALSLSYAQAYPERLHGVIGMSAPPLNALLGILAESEAQQQASDYMQRFGKIDLEQIRMQNLHRSIAVSSYAKLLTDGQLHPDEIALFHDAVGQVEAVNGGMNWYRANVPPWSEIGSDDRWPGPDVRLQVPSLFIWGDDDTIFFPETIEALLAREPNLEIARLPGVGHWTSMDEPDKANRAIRNFINDLKAPS